MQESYTCTLLEQYTENLSGTAIMLGSANLPFHEVNWIKGLPLDFNAAEGKRFERLFPGCSELDQIERYGEELFHSMFKFSEKYNVSFDPLSGTQANQIVYNAILKPGSTVLALSVQSGGHCSHIDYLKKYHTVIEYHYNKQINNIDYHEIDMLCSKYSPDLLIAGASSFPLSIKYDVLGKIARKYNVLLLADISHTVLYILEQLHVSPFGEADFVTFTTHKTTRGPRGAILSYKNKFAQAIEKSIFPVSQGAPIYTQICCKVAMLECLKKRTKNEYCNSILKLTQLFIQNMKRASIPLWIDHSDTHLCILDLSGFPNSISYYQKLLEDSGIYANASFLPDDNDKKSGLRFGFMYLATLNIMENDFIKLINIIIQIIQTGIPFNKDETSMIIRPYYRKYMEENYE